MEFTNNTNSNRVNQSTVIIE